MLITSDALLSASKQVLDDRNVKKQDKADKEEYKLEETKSKDIAAYDTFKKGDKVIAALWNDVLNYILIATESSDKISSFKNKQ